MNEDYIRYLISGIDKDEFVLENLYGVCECLYSMPYLPSVGKDINRLSDSEHLRKSYYYDTGLKVHHNIDCTVFEVFVYISLYVGEYLSEGFMDTCNKANECFIYILKSLGVYILRQPMEDIYVEIEQAIHSWEDGEFLRNGIGGPFAIGGFSGDMRCISLWEMTQLYLSSFRNERKFYKLL